MQLLYEDTNPNVEIQWKKLVVEQVAYVIKLLQLYPNIPIELRKEYLDYWLQAHYLPYILQDKITIYFQIGPSLPKRTVYSSELSDEEILKFVKSTKTKKWVRANVARIGEEYLELSTLVGLTFDQLKEVVSSPIQVMCAGNHYSIMEPYPSDSIKELSDGYSILINEILKYLKLPQIDRNTLHYMIDSETAPALASLQTNINSINNDLEEDTIESDFIPDIKQIELQTLKTQIGL
jgi:hypothetical protein